MYVELQAYAFCKELPPVMLDANGCMVAQVDMSVHDMLSLNNGTCFFFFERTT